MDVGDGMLVGAGVRVAVGMSVAAAVGEASAVDEGSDVGKEVAVEGKVAGGAHATMSTAQSAGAHAWKRALRVILCEAAKMPLCAISTEGQHQ